MIYFQLKSARGNQKVIGYYVQLRYGDGRRLSENRSIHNNFLGSSNSFDVVSILGNNEVIYNAALNKYVMMRHSDYEEENKKLQEEKIKVATEVVWKTNQSKSLSMKPIGNGFYAQVYSKVSSVSERLQSFTLMEKVNYFCFKLPELL